MPGRNAPSAIAMDIDSQILSDTSSTLFASDIPSPSLGSLQRYHVDPRISTTKPKRFSAAQEAGMATALRANQTHHAILSPKKLAKLFTNDLRFC
jgi:hypothetical protein